MVNAIKVTREIKETTVVNMNIFAKEYNCRGTYQRVPGTKERGKIYRELTGEGHNIGCGVARKTTTARAN